MNKEEALKIIVEMQRWRRGQSPYDCEQPVNLPYTSKQYGEALDVAIGILATDNHGDSRRLGWLERHSGHILQESKVKTGNPFRWGVEVPWESLGEIRWFLTLREAIDDMMERYPERE
jgi:hypothetical protein